MREPDTVAKCVDAMKRAAPELPVTVKVIICDIPIAYLI